MIGKCVKACFWALVVMLVAGCSGKPKPSVESARAGASIPAGAEAWQGGGLLLPANSPAVFTGRLAGLLDAATRLKAWIIAEPAMLGPNGAGVTRTIETGWMAATAYLGVDPLKPEAWTERGIDPLRTTFIGVYPVQRDGRRFISAVDGVLREELGVAPGQSVSRSLQMLSAAGSQLPEGTHAQILRDVADSRPIGGLRVVIPVSDPDEFLITGSSFAEGMGFRPFAPNPAEDGSHRFWSEGDEVPTMAIRLLDEFAVVDVVFGAFAGGAKTSVDRDAALGLLHTDLARALQEVPSGRPAAPAPPNDPAASASFDQAGMAELAKLRGYATSLEDLQATGTEKRDAVLLQTLMAAASEADSWSVAADELTGTSFHVDVKSPASSTLGTLRMTMFARAGLAALDSARVSPSLDLSKRSAAFGVDLTTLRNAGWRSWFVGETAAEFDALEFKAMRPSHTLLPGVRAGLIAVSNLGDADSASVISTQLADALAELDAVHRLEVVALEPDVSRLQQTPELLVAAVLPADAPAGAVEELEVAVATALVEWSSPGTAVPSLPKLKAGKTGTVKLGDSVLRVHVVQSPDHRVVLFGLGASPQAFDAELAALAKPMELQNTFEGRLEPIALLAWLRDGDDELFDPLDVDILAQRLGALTMSYHASSVGPSNTVTLELRLHAPPRL